MKRLLALVVVLILLSTSAFAQGRDLYKWRNRLLEGYAHLQLTVDRLPRIVSARDSKNVERRYLVFTYRLSNAGEKPFVLRPSFEVLTDTDAIYAEVFREDVLHQVRLMNGRNYHSSRQIVERLSVDRSTGRRMRKPLLMPGQSLYAAAIFQDVDPAADTLRIYGFGLADSLKIEEKDGKKVPLIEARVVSFYRPGDRFHPDRAISVISEDWESVEVELTQLDPKLLPSRY